MRKKQKMEEIKIKNLDHLGIIAGIVDELEIVEKINEKVKIDCREKITAGLVVKAIILNGLGFVSRPLYLFNQFFQDKELEKLLGKGIESQHLNDDKLGRVMDELYALGLSNIFLEIALLAVNKFKIETEYTHLDSTSFHVHGEYKSEKPQEEEKEVFRARPIYISKGYSRDHRPDLKQCVLDLIVSPDGDLPLLMRVGDGNESDKALFGQIVAEFKNQVEFQSIMVSDSALYSEKNLRLMKGIKWITRVPLTLKKAKEFVQILEIEENKEGEKIEGYKWKEEKVEWGEVMQRWIVFESEERKQSDLEKLEKKQEKEREKVKKMMNKLKKEKWKNPSEARKELSQNNQKLKLFTLEEVQLIRETTKEKKPVYQLEIGVKLKTEEIEKRQKQAGRFILATNLMDEETCLSPREILTTRNVEKYIQTT